MIFEIANCDHNKIFNNLKLYSIISYRGGSMENELITNTIENRIYTIRGQKVMLDYDLASLFFMTIQ